MLNGLFYNSKSKYISRESNVIKFNDAKNWHVSSPFKKFYQEKKQREQDIKKFATMALAGNCEEDVNFPYFDEAIETLLSNPKFLDDIIV